jgi:large subunit ribosomal protein L21
MVSGASVLADVIEHKRGEKKLTFKMRRREGYHKTIGHRQELTVLKITDVRYGDKSAAAEALEVAEKAKAEHDLVVAAATRQAAEDASLAAKLAKRVRADETEDKPAAKPARKTTKATAVAADETKGAAKPAKAKAEPKTAAKADAGAKPDAEAPKKRARTKKDE